MTGTESLTLNLPIEAVRRLERVASVSRRSIDDVAVMALDAGLPPLVEDLPAALREYLTPLEAFSNDQLREEASQDLPEAEQQRYEGLLDANKAGALTDAQRAELDVLRETADRLMLRRGYAAVILRWRGEPLPNPDDEPF